MACKSGHNPDSGYDFPHVLRQEPEAERDEATQHVKSSTRNGWRHGGAVDSVSESACSLLLPSADVCAK